MCFNIEVKQKRLPKVYTPRDLMPSLPLVVKKFLVFLMPWVTLFIGIMYVLGIFAFLMTIFSTLLPADGLLYELYQIIFFLSSLCGMLLSVIGVYSLNMIPGSLVDFVICPLIAFLLLKSFHKLRFHKKIGWNNMFFVLCLEVISGVTDGYLPQTIIFSFISFYFLYQIKFFYK